jgi:hypothetical protein
MEAGRLLLVGNADKVAAVVSTRIEPSRPEWSAGNPSIDVGCCSSLIHCRPGWSTGSLSIDMGRCSSPIHCRFGWSADINVGYCSSMIRCGSRQRAGISYVTDVMSSIL